MADLTRTLDAAATAPRADDDVAGWARFPRHPQRRRPLWWTSDPVPWVAGGGNLPRGLGRSYGDSALARGGALIEVAPCDRLLALDAAEGLVTAEAGASLGAIAAAALPSGWYPPAMPGTRHVTLGGAIANDIHGKNHASAGTFGRHVRSLELVRSDREGPLRVVPGDPLFAATIGGLGLTGVVVRATLALTRVPGPGIASGAWTFDAWDAYFDRAVDASRAHAHTVGWFAPGRRGTVRGTFSYGDPVDGPARWLAEPASRVSIPFDLPEVALCRASIAAFNALYLGAGARAAKGTRVLPVWPFMHPLDGCAHVNRIYGRRGFLQYHFVVPRGPDRTEVPAIVAAIADAGFRMFLPVMKQFGALESPGPLSFPLAGTSVAVDLPWQGERLLGLLDEIDARVAACGGRVYVAKDARMSASAFRAFYPRWEEVERHRDPAHASHFWRRVTGIAA